MINLQALAQQLLLSVKKEQPTLARQRQLREVSCSELRRQLVDDRSKKTFWINCYNAYFQLLRKAANLPYPDIYRKRAIGIAGYMFSLDDIEHGILRGYRYKRKPEQFSANFEPGVIRSLMVGEVDGRIHFALNCGAVSCPPIAFYQSATLDQQLEQATEVLLTANTEVIPAEKTVLTTELLKWYADDFGGNTAVRQLLERHLGQDLSGYQINYHPYSWEEALSNFVESTGTFMVHG